MERSAELEDFVRESYAIMLAGNVSALDGVLSHAEETLMIGTDPDEWWEGRDAFLTAFQGQTEAMGGGITLTGGDPRAYVEGDMGWVADRPSYRLPDGTELSARVTGVLRKENGNWRWVQSHSSIGVANEAAFGKELPI
jgi:ketosteroid isomerase-like protein